MTINNATYGSAWKDLMNVHSNVRIPSPRLKSFTNLITRNSRKNNVIDTPDCCELMMNKQATLIKQQFAFKTKCGILITLF